MYLVLDPEKNQAETHTKKAAFFKGKILDIQRYSQGSNTFKETTNIHKNNDNRSFQSLCFEHTAHLFLVFLLLILNR